MEQRPLRLGDIVDDYCPRERRITNHAIVALVGEAIRQTRCTTCDAEHVYKAARLPRRKKPDATAALYEQVLTDASPAQSAPQRNGEMVDPPAPLTAAGDRTDDPAVGTDRKDDAEKPAPPNGADAASEPPQPDARPDEAWAAHRPLIRATLPRTEGEPPAPRPIPEFTMHQRRTRGGQGFRQGGWQANGNQRGNGFRPGRSGQGHGHGQGQGQGNGPGHRHESGGRSGRRHGSRNKRSR
jgi:hypothetical protein